MQVLAEGFSRAGVPVFLADVKGDVSGLAMQGRPHPKVDERIESIGIEGFHLRGNPVVFWDMYGKKRPSGTHHSHRAWPIADFESAGIE
jgi:DNA helicase HerA-like ATPase